MGNRWTTSHHARRRLAMAGMIWLGAALVVPGAAVRADQTTTTETAANAGNGGVADPDASADVTIGNIVSGQNTGHAVATGDTYHGDVTIVVGDMATTANAAVTAEVNPLLADASGGDDAAAKPSVGDPTGDGDGLVINNSSDASADAAGGTGGAGGEGGDAQGGAGGDGGSVIIDGEVVEEGTPGEPGESDSGASG